MNSLVVESKRGAKCPSVTCYLCGREFGTTSIGIHEKNCITKWERSQAVLPKEQRRPRPQKPQPIHPSSTSPSSSQDMSLSDRDAYNAAAQNAYLETARAECPNCGRKFEQSRLDIHLKSCKPGGFFAKKMEERRAQTTATTCTTIINKIAGDPFPPKAESNPTLAKPGPKLINKPNSASQSQKGFPTSSNSNLAKLSNVPITTTTAGRPITGKTPSVKKPPPLGQKEQFQPVMSVTGTVAKQTSRPSTALRKSNSNLVQAAPKFCVECGTKQEVESWKFCAQCGTRRPV